MFFVQIILFFLFSSLTHGRRFDYQKRHDGPHNGVQQDSLVEQFPWDDLEKQTSVNPEDYLPEISKNVRNDFSCTESPGPDRIGCSSAIAVWPTLANEEGEISLSAGECQSVTKDCCQSVICAPLKDLSVVPGEATGRMWLPLTMRCVVGGHGGVWISDEAGLFVQLRKPDSEECEATA